MTLQVLHTVSGVLIILALAGKIGVHYYLDYLQFGTASPASIVMMPLHYIRPYKNVVNNRYCYLKSACNWLLLLAVISLALNIIVGILIYMRY